LHGDAQERERGYREACAAAGVAVDALLMETGGYLEEGGRLAMERLLDSGHRFSAVFTANDQMGFGVALTLYRRGLRMPQDLSLVGFDDLFTSAYSIPPLTTVHQPVQELGRSAATAMLQMLRGEKPEAALPAPRLVIRESTDVCSG
jgi:LacI family transcriptional regulator